jgi:hypothetical protein
LALPDRILVRDLQGEKNEISRTRGHRRSQGSLMCILVFYNASRVLTHMTHD